mmetsp:Transcript_10481/g.32255  ORF Transcript_10481/g.32255 Transcript_10481/m.32255 type:complete len:192 (+) Transcript_10481:2099-2674(+)
MIETAYPPWLPWLALAIVAAATYVYSQECDASARERASNERSRRQLDSKNQQLLVANREKNQQLLVVNRENNQLRHDATTREAELERTRADHPQGRRSSLLGTASAPTAAHDRPLVGETHASSGGGGAAARAAASRAIHGAQTDSRTSFWMVLPSARHDAAGSLTTPSARVKPGRKSAPFKRLIERCTWPV